MTCTVCEELIRDFRHEGEVEATAILQQRSSWFENSNTKRTDNLDDTILTSRKRQAQLAVRLNDHRSNHHSVARAAS